MINLKGVNLFPQVTLINQRFRDIAMTNRDQQEEIAHLNVQLDQLTNIVKVSILAARDNARDRDV